MLALLPAVLALALILLTRQAALALLVAALSGCLLLAGGNPLTALEQFFTAHLFPSLNGDWHLGPMLFTLTLGAFATVLEKSGGFQALIARMLPSDPSDDQMAGQQKKLMFSVYGLGLLCFFDGVANSILVGRVSRPLIDRMRISRQFLAYMIDSTSSAVACVAIVSTWVATQLSLIKEGLADAAIEVSPTQLYLASIPANPYCLGTLILLPLVIWRGWFIGPMGRTMEQTAKGELPSAVGELPDSSSDNEAPAGAGLASVVVPLVVLLIAVPGLIYLWQDDGPRSWQHAFASAHVPHAMLAAGLLALLAACICFPKARRPELPKHMLDGAASLLPALIILVLAWSLGSVFQALGTAELLSQMLSGSLQLQWLPLAVFLTAAITSFLTGSSWGTMGLLMPLCLPIALELGQELPPELLAAALPWTIGAVFGGAVFGDHCSPFSDTTIVSSLASGCTPTSHIVTQMPYALITAAFAALYYAVSALF